jgi:hypothetical protein
MHRFMIIFAALLLAGVCLVRAEEEEPDYGWKKEVVGSFHLTQTSFDNWSQGGEGSLAWQAGLNGAFTKLMPSYEWVNQVKLEYGTSKIEGQESRKNVDEIRLESVFNLNVGWVFAPYASFTAQTQFTKGYAYTDTSKTVVSDFMDPGYFTVGAGLSYAREKIFRTRLGFAGKYTVTDEFPVPYADDPDTPDEIEKTRFEPGMESVSDLSLKFGGNLLFATKLEMFSNLKATNEIDVNWDNLLTAKVNDYVNCILNFRLFYDRDVSTKRQLKQSLALGLSYSFL